MWHRRTAAEKSKDVAHLATYYWSRLLATCGCWFFWDFGFYGNKVFQSQFVKIITGGSAFLASAGCLAYLCSMVAPEIVYGALLEALRCCLSEGAGHSQLALLSTPGIEPACVDLTSDTECTALTRAVAEFPCASLRAQPAASPPPWRGPC